MNLTIDEDAGFSPFRAPYGGIEAEESDGLAAFQDHALDWCSKHGLRILRMRFAPENYFEYHPEPVGAIIEETNQSITVSENHLSYSEVKRLRKCQRAGFTFRLQPVHKLAEAYELLRDSRLRKDYPVTMTYDELEAMFKSHPDHYYLYGISHQDRLIAAAVTIAVTSSIWYNFYHADHSEYLTYSPTVMLVEGIRQEARTHGCRLLDLGISSNEGKLNESLFRFKKNLGATTSIKYHCTITL